MMIIIFIIIIIDKIKIITYLLINKIKIYFY